MNWFKRLFGGEQKPTQGDPLILTLASDVTMPLVRVPAGIFMMGSGDDNPKADINEKPLHEVQLDEYLIGKHPVTVSQFRVFVEATGYKVDSEALPSDKDDYPVTMVTWDDAMAFCSWVSKMTRRRVFLPTEAQWEKAARGTDSRIYPWGNQSPDSNRCDVSIIKDGHTTSVGKYSPLGDSPYGCADMAGNVWEYVSDWYKRSYYSISPKFSPTGPTTGRNKVSRGGSFGFDPPIAQATYRQVSGTDEHRFDTGFRCAVSPGA